MEDIIIEGLDYALDFVLAATVGIAAFLAAQYFISQYQETIYQWIKKNLAGHPDVQRVALRAMQANHHVKKAIRVKVGETVYVLTQMLGIKKDTRTAETMTRPVVSVPTESTTRVLTAEELARYAGGTFIAKSGATEAELLEQGLVPEKAARGMGLIDKNGDVKGLHEICSESKLLDLRQAA